MAYASVNMSHIPSPEMVALGSGGLCGFLGTMLVRLQLSYRTARAFRCQTKAYEEKLGD